jgi:N-acyl-D-aspartate/D-glutamate deacylase
MSALLIRGGTVVDGTGAPGFAADVRVSDGMITEVGSNLAAGAGERVIDAGGCFVAPGFIESHTHFDGTMWWEPQMDPLPGFGVTTSIMGNCGFSAAPVSKDAAARLEMVKIFSFFEDIPIEPFLKELPWDWETWSEYKQSMVRNLKVSGNYAAFVGHIAIRLAAMGMAAWDRVATPQEIERMAELLDDALKAGALGMSTNLLDHDGENRPIPTLVADDAEFSALLAVLEKYPATSLQIVVDTFMRMSAPAQMERIAKLCGTRKIRVQWAGGIPTLEFQKGIQGGMVAQFEEFKKRGLDFWAGYAHVSPTNTLSIKRSLIFAQSNDYVWHEVVLAETDQEKSKLLRDPDWRARARHSWDVEAIRHSPMANGKYLFLLNSDNGVGPIRVTLGEYAEQLGGVHPSDAMAEWLLANGLDSTVHMPPFPIDEDMTLKLLKDKNTVGNINDAPAHGQMLCGGGENMLLFTKYVKELGVLTVEEAVHVMTGKLAGFFNLQDRGEIKVGKRADIAVFDLDEIRYQDIKKVHDVPDGFGGKIWRWTRDAAPMRLTLVNGVPTFENGKFTGELPGQLLSPALSAK